MTSAKASPARVDIVVIGSGFSGLGMGAALKRAGREDFVILEKAGDLGGTWRDNTYPGCACDIPSHLYSFSFAAHPGWSRMYPSQGEIWAYQKACADRFGLRPHLRFGQEVVRLAYDDAALRWHVETAAGAQYTARAVVCGLGGLHVPGFAAIPGRERFAGPSFHTAQWDHGVALAGKRVGVIGTGASAVQLVPEVAKEAAHLTLFQRTPPWVLPKGDRAMSVLERWLFGALPPVQAAYRAVIFALNEVRALAFTRDVSRMDLAKRQALRHLRTQVADPVLRAQLTPDYTIGCKRVLISNDYYPALQRRNVTLETGAVAEITEGGVRLADGRAVELDVLIHATGFKAFDILSRLQVSGLGGRSLNAEWAQAPYAHRGVTVSGYPNLFFLMGPNTGLGHNSMIVMIEAGIAYVMDALARMEAERVDALDVDQDAQTAWNADVQARLQRTVWHTGCRSWYLTPDGRNPTLWPDFTTRFSRLTRKLDREHYRALRENPKHEGVVIESA
jgi:cation diffusion facilitator CzcD-associated flavoprotein CzcO